jgi:hypothetical protein
MILQLNPQLPVTTKRGRGFALALIDYSQDHNLFWVVAQTETGEIWTYENNEVRAEKNITLGRFPAPLRPDGD